MPCVQLFRKVRTRALHLVSFTLAFPGSFISTATAQDFLLGVANSLSVSTNPIVQVAIARAGADTLGNTYVLAGGLTSTCRPIGSPSVGCVLQPASVIVKLSSAGAVIWQTTVSPLFETMAVDGAGDIYLAGGNSAEELGPDGQTLIYNTTIGGTSVQIGAIALDSAGRLYLTGSVLSGDLTPTLGPLQPGSANPYGFAARLTSTGAVDYATYLGANVMAPYGIAVDPTNSAYVIWSSAGSGFPVPLNAQPFSVLTRLSADGQSLVYSAFIGAAGALASYVAVDSSGQALVAFSAGAAGLGIERFNPQGSALNFSVTLPGQAFGGLAVDNSDNIYAYDSVIPDSANYPARNSLSSCQPGYQNALTVFDSSGNLVQSTYVPDGQTPAAFAILPDSSVDLVSAPATGGLNLLHLSQNPQARTVQLACAGNAASYDDNFVSPGELVSLFGSGLGPIAPEAPQVTPDSGFPETLAGVQVTFNGVPAPLLYVQDAQINAIAPWSLQSGQPVDVCVTYNANRTNCIRMTAAGAHPGVFAFGTHAAIALNRDGTLNSSRNPAKAGSFVSIFATGLGPLDPLPADGSIVGLPLPSPMLPATMYTIGALDGVRVPVDVQYSGPAPFEVAGVSQINFQAASTMTGGLIFVSVGDSALSNGFTIFVTE